MFHGRDHSYSTNTKQPCCAICSLTVNLLTKSAHRSQLVNKKTTSVHRLFHNQLEFRRNKYIHLRKFSVWSQHCKATWPLFDKKIKIQKEYI